MKEFIEYIAKKLVDKPDKVSVEETIPDEHTIEINLKVDKSDMGRVIGKQGNTVNAMRTLLIAVGGKEHHRVVLKIFDPDKDAK
ncbi:MAG: KH domain-containing protein [Ignavibacteriaceae bacterium]|nr:KH domain-containing protein [Ignavibacteriaceae bacterium]